MIVDETAIEKALAQAPQVIREYIDEGRLAEQVVECTDPYNLHVDTIGIVAELARNMLVGLSSPAELFGELVMSGVDAETAKKVLADLNEKIFVPLAGAVRTAPASTAAQAPAVPTPVQATPRPISPVASADSPTPHIEQRPTPPIAPLTPAIPPAAPPASMSPASASSVPRKHEAMRTMASDMQAEKQHRVPEPIFERPVAPTPIPTPAISHVAVPPMPPTPYPVASVEPPHPPVMSAPPTAPIAPPSIPSTLPVVPSSMPTPPAVPPPTPMPPVPAQQNVLAPEPKSVPLPPNLPRTPQPNQYPIDPYREPVE